MSNNALNYARKAIFLLLFWGLLAPEIFASRHLFFIKGSPDDAVGFLLRLKTILQSDENPEGLVVIEGDDNMIQASTFYYQTMIKSMGLEEAFEVVQGIRWDKQVKEDISNSRFGLRLKNEVLNATAILAKLKASGATPDSQPSEIAIEKIRLFLSSREKVSIISFSEGSSLIAALSTANDLPTLRKQIADNKFRIDSSLFGTNISDFRWMAGGRPVANSDSYELARSWALLFSILGPKPAVRIINALLGHPGSIVFGTSFVGGNLGRADNIEEDFHGTASAIGIDTEQYEFSTSESYLTQILPLTWIEAVREMLGKPGIPAGYASSLGAFMGLVDFSFDDQKKLVVSGLGKIHFKTSTTSHIISPIQTEQEENSSPLRLTARIVDVQDVQSVEGILAQTKPVETAMVFYLARCAKDLASAKSEGGLIELSKEFNAYYAKQLDESVDRKNVFSTLLRHYSLADIYSDLKTNLLVDRSPLIITTDTNEDDHLAYVPLLQILSAIRSQRPIYFITQSFDTLLQKAQLEEVLAPFRSTLNINVFAGSGGDKLSDSQRRKIAEFSVAGINTLAEAALSPDLLALHRNDPHRESQDGLKILEQLLIHQQLPVDIIALSDIRDIAKLCEKHGIHALKSVRTLIGNFWKLNDQLRPTSAYNGKIYAPGFTDFFTNWQNSVALFKWPTHFHHLSSNNSWELNIADYVQGGRLSHPEVKDLLIKLSQSRTFGSLGKALWLGYHLDTDAFEGSQQRTRFEFREAKKHGGDVYVADSLITAAALSILFQEEVFTKLGLELPKWKYQSYQLDGVSEDNLHPLAFVLEDEGRVSRDSFLIDTALDQSPENLQMFIQVLVGSLNSLMRTAYASDLAKEKELDDLSMVINSSCVRDFERNTPGSDQKI